MKIEELIPEGVDEKRVVKTLNQWGWSVPPDNVVREAVDCVRVDGKSLAESLEILGYCTRDRVESLQEDREKKSRRDLSQIDFISSQEAKVRDNKQRILCLMGGIQYFQSLNSEHLQTHDMLKNPEIRTACERHECVLMTLQEKTPVLVFTDYDTSLKRYKQIAGFEASNDPLRTQFPNVSYAIAPKAQVIAAFDATRNKKVDDGGASTDSPSNSMGMIYGERLRDDPILRKLATIHDLALELEASDIHIDPDSEGRIHLSHRVRGDMERITETLDMKEYSDIKTYLLRRAGATLKFERLKEPKDGMYQYVGRSAQAYVRCSFIPLGHSSGSEDLISICLRLIPMEHGRVDLLQKGVHPDVVEFIKYAVTPDAGIVLLVGPTGSGKSTTVSGTVGLHEQIHGTKKTRFSIEDPVERFLPGITQFQIPYHLRGKGAGFSLILRNILRHDPNLIWLGEIRDAETAEISVQAAATGHLLVSTIHADSVTKAVERLANMVPPDRSDLKNALIENMSLLVCQRLIKRLCEHCSKKGPPTAEQTKYIDYVNNQRGLTLELPENVSFANPKGCGSPGCRGGYSGRIPVNEVLNVTTAVKQIYMGDDAKERFRLIEQSVNIRMEDAIMDKIRDGLTDVEALEF